MRFQKNKTARTVCAVVSAFMVPVVIISAVIYSPSLSSATKKATMLMASLSFGGKSPPFSESKLEQPAIQASATIKSQTPAFVLDETVVLSNDTLWGIDEAPEEIETPLTLNQLPFIVPEGTDDLPYPSSMENKSGIIKEVNYGAYTGSQFFALDGGGVVKNCTSISNETLYNQSKILPDFKIEANTDQPQVLIMHTHTTESYEPYERDFYDASFISRTTDNSKNVVAVGEAIAQELRNAGISVIHDTTVHDYPEYNGSYQRSNVTVSEILRQYPSIKVVLDIHRDALSPSDGVRNAPVTTIDGNKAAQIMIISGCDNGNMGMPNYMKNFSLASLLQQNTESAYPGITRPVLFDYRNYNQELTTGSLLIEVGSHGNSIDQALLSGQLFGKALAQTLLMLT